MMKVRLIFYMMFFMLGSSSMLDAYTKRTEMVAMRDSVRLATDIYKPVTSKPPWPVILMRTPYSRSSAIESTLVLIICNFMHYVIVVQNTRGRYASEGLDSLYFSDAWGPLQDGYDTLEWLKSQSWCNGKIGTLGASALGITQYMLAGSDPPELDCCVVLVAASNLYEDALFYGGEYRECLIDGWLQGNRSEHLIPFFTDHPNYEPLYDRLNLLTRSSYVHVPMIHVGGWHDIFVQGQINAFQALQNDGGSGAFGRQKLIIGPWEHDISKEKTGELTFPNSSSAEWLGVMLDWFDYYLKDEDLPITEIPAVQYYLMGDPELPGAPGNRWVQAETWPPEHEIIPLYFHEDSILSLDLPWGEENPDYFIFDPDSFVPTIGGRNLNIPAGPRDQRETENREDVLVYTTRVLEDSVIVTGPVTITLFASSDAVDTDFTGKLCDVYPDGRSILVADGIIRARHRYSLSEENFLVPGEITEFRIDLWSTAMAFAPGHRIRVAVSSSNYPRFSVNPNTGESFRKETGKFIASQTVYHSEQYPSSLNLPVVSGLVRSGLEVQGPLPHGWRLDQNVPNPFNKSTMISFFIPEGKGPYQLRILDILGRTIREWPALEETGEVRLAWQGTDQSGHPVPSGMYMMQLTGNTWRLTRKAIVLD